MLTVITNLGPHQPGSNSLDAPSLLQPIRLGTFISQENLKAPLLPSALSRSPMQESPICLSPSMILPEMFYGQKILVIAWMKKQLPFQPMIREMYMLQAILKMKHYSMKTYTLRKQFATGSLYIQSYR